MHIPVLLSETVEALAPAAGKRFLDGTAGGGGHTAALLARGAMVIATDADLDAVARVRAQLNSAVVEGKLRVEQAWLDQSVNAAQDASLLPLDGVLADLGLSSFQLDTAERGFAFMREGPLDMRFDRSRGLSASEWLEQSDVWDIARALRDFGDVPNPRRVAEAIWAARPIKTTAQLRDLVDGLVKTRSGKIHPATMVFQALRIVVNDELRRLSDALPGFVDALRPGGRVAIIAFHSLEDRIVKNVFRDLARTIEAEPGFGEQVERAARVRVLTKDPITPGELEIAANPRARSAKLRVAEKL
jgi:16S rRNA (cytosine1402-N4)-methyltransferase